MPSVSDNIRRWTNKDWSARGEEWCAGFGGADKAWEHAVLPRINSFLPTGHVLELGPGYGLWTARLRDLSSRMTLVDLAPNCIEACRDRFGDTNMAYHTNDGRSLTMLEDNSIDFVFSFNSLVHADREVMRDYAEQLGAKMKPAAVGFVHHSNLGEYAAEIGTMERGDEHWRGRDMTAGAFRDDCRNAGLVCVHQEIIPWGSHRFIDTISLFIRPAPDQTLTESSHRNADFWHQARAGDHSAGAWYTKPR